MNTWFEWGISIINWMQSLGEGLIAPMQFFSFLGIEIFYLSILPALFWCFDISLALRIGVIMLSSACLNGPLKLLFGLPRPYWIGTEIQALSSETSYGLPSGHAQNAIAFWGRMAADIKRRWATILLAILIFLISISRLFLGMHFSADILAGWFFGGLLLWAFVRYEKSFLQWLFSFKLSYRILVVLALSLAFIALGLAASALTANRPVPEAWSLMAASSAAQKEPIDPRSLSGIISAAATLFGIGAGSLLLAEWNQFKPDGRWQLRVLRYIAGMAGVMIIFVGLRAVFPHGSSLVAQIARFIRYGTVGFLVSYLAPRAFVALHLA